MPSLSIVTASARTTPRHPRVTLSSPSGAVSVPLAVTSPEVDLENLAREWFEIDRPGRKPLLGAGGKRLTRVAIEALIDSDVEAGYPGTVEQHLLALVNMARAAEAIVVAYVPLGTASQLTSAGRWVIGDMRIRSLRLEPGTNKPLRARVSFELIEDSPVRPVEGPKVGPPAPKEEPRWHGLTAAEWQELREAGMLAPPASPTGPSERAPGTARRHTIVTGDTLWHLATIYYGDGNLWPRIAEANGIRDPRSLAAGQVVTVP